MNKWQIICPIAAMALFLAFCVPPAIKRINMNRQDAITLRAYGVGRELETATNSALLVSIDPPLRQALAQFLTTPTGYDEHVFRGDEPPPLGDGTASHRLYLRNEKGQWLTLRLQHDPTLKQFRVLGSFTPPNPPEKAYH